MPFSVYTIEQNQEWDAVVRSFQSYDVYYLSGYVKAFQIHGDGDPLLLYYEEASDNSGIYSIRGINVVMKRDISKDARFTEKIEENEWFDFITPYGYGGWLIEGQGDVSQLFHAYINWCTKNNVVSEFVRYHPVLENHRYSYGFYNILELGYTIAMDLSSPEVIWANLTSKNRNMVRKAQRSGIMVYNGRYPEIFNTFREIYNGTMDRDDAETYYYFKPEFYKSIMKDLPQEAQIFYAELEGKVIAASIMLSSNGRLNYHLSGSLREFQTLAPSNLLLYTAALWGCYNGCTTLHLGGGVGSSEDSLYKFKKAFNRGKPCKFHIGQKVLNIEMYERLVQMRNQDEIRGSGFFPKYRV